jgi:glycosyltransferase involved in cell wall biosynthesis
MIRVLNVVGLSLGGAETTVVNYYRYIDRNKVQFDFLIPNEPNPQFYEEEVASLGARIFRMPADSKFKIFGANNPRRIKRLIQVLRQSPGVDVIQFHECRSVLPALGSLTAMLMGVKVRVAYSRNQFFGWQPLHSLFKPLLNMTATHKAACSTDAGVYMFGKKVTDSLLIMPRARDLEAFRYNPGKRLAIRKELQLDDKYTIAQVGRMHTQKNHVFLIDAFAHAVKENPDIILLLIGDGPLREGLEAQTRDHGLENKVRFLGARTDVFDILQAADLFVFPSLYEGLGAVAIEAQAAGLPCLISDTVPKGAKVTDLVEFLPIDKGPGIWAEKMLVYRDFKRRDTMDDVKKAGYDIQDAAKWLENLYIKAVEERK